MLAVGIREMKNSLSKYLRKVKNGETVLVTERGQVIAQLAPPPDTLAGPRESEREALARLARAGLVRLAEGELVTARGALPVALPEGVDAGALLDAIRADRF